MASSKRKPDLSAVRIEEIDLSSLTPDPANARKHTDRNRQAVDRSLKAFGAARSIVVDAKGIVRAGNQTLESAKQAGITKALVIDAQGDRLVVVRRRDWTPAQATAYAIADNRTGELAEWDQDALSTALEALREERDIDFASTGFTLEDLAELLPPRPIDGLTDEDAVPEPPDDPITQRGDIWVLGDHRLMCGDSGSVEDLDRLLDGATIDLVNMDPPYNVKVEPRSNNAIAAGVTSFSRREDLQCERSQSERGKRDRERLRKKMHHQRLDLARHPERAKATHKKMRAKDRPLENDFVTDEQFDELLLAWFSNASRVLKPGGSFYIWGGYANLDNYPKPLKEAGLYFSQAIVWDKQHPVLTRKDFMGAFEICFYGWKEGAGHRFFGPNNATDLWHVKKVSPQNMVHLTEKPVELAVRAIQYSSLPGENVLDLFGGSGSTLIGCEQTGRRAYLMEIDPLYCDVIVKRWEQFTGRKAERIVSDATKLPEKTSAKAAEVEEAAK